MTCVKVACEGMERIYHASVCVLKCYAKILDLFEIQLEPRLRNVVSGGRSNIVSRLGGGSLGRCCV